MAVLDLQTLEKSNQNEDARVLTTLYIDFLDAKRQLTPKSVVESDRNSN